MPQTVVQLFLQSLVRRGNDRLVGTEGPYRTSPVFDLGSLATADEEIESTAATDIASNAQNFTGNIVPQGQLWIVSGLDIFVSVAGTGDAIVQASRLYLNPTQRVALDLERTLNNTVNSRVGWSAPYPLVLPAGQALGFWIRTGLGLNGTATIRQRLYRITGI